MWSVLQEDVDRAAEMIEDLLQPQDETRLEHKRMQLRELAALNGTLKDEDVRLSYLHAHYLHFTWFHKFMHTALNMNVHLTFQKTAELKTVYWLTTNPQHYR